MSDETLVKLDVLIGGTANVLSALESIGNALRELNLKGATALETLDKSMTRMAKGNSSKMKTMADSVSDAMKQMAKDVEENELTTLGIVTNSNKLHQRAYEARFTAAYEARRKMDVRSLKMYAENGVKLEAEDKKRLDLYKQVLKNRAAATEAAAKAETAAILAAAKDQTATAKMVGDAKRAEIKKVEAAIFAAAKDETATAKMVGDAIRVEEALKQAAILKTIQLQVRAATNNSTDLYQRYSPKNQIVGSLVNASTTKDIDYTGMSSAIGPMKGLLYDKKITSELEKEMNKLPPVIDKARLHLKGMGSNLLDVHSLARGLASGFNLLWLTWGSMTPLLAGAAISMSFTKALSVGSSVLENLADIQQLAGATTEDVNLMTSAMMSLGQSSMYGPVQTSEALRILALAGLSAKDSLLALKPTLDFALTGGIDTEKAAETLIAVTTAYGYAAAQVSVVGDVIAKTAAVSMTSVDKMSESFRVASTVAQQYGVSLNDSALILGTLSQIGITGQAAGTAMRNYYNYMVSGSGPAKKAMKELGLEVYNQAGMVKDAVTLAEETFEKLSKKTIKEQQNIINAMSTERGAKVVSATMAAATKAHRELEPEEAKRIERLKRMGQEEQAARLQMELSGSQLRKMREEIANAPGFTAIAAAGKELSPENQWKAIKAAMETSLFAAFKSMNDLLFITGNKLREVFNSKEFHDGMSTMTRMVASFVGGLVDLVAWVGKNTDTIRDWATGIGVAVAAIVTLTTAYNVFIATTVLSTGAVVTWGTATVMALKTVSAALLTTPAGWAILAASVVAGGLAYLAFRDDATEAIDEVIKKERELKEANKLRDESFFKSIAASTKADQDRIKALKERKSVEEIQANEYLKQANARILADSEVTVALLEQTKIRARAELPMTQAAEANATTDLEISRAREVAQRQIAAHNDMVARKIQSARELAALETKPRAHGLDDGESSITKAAKVATEEKKKQYDIELAIAQMRADLRNKEYADLEKFIKDDEANFARRAENAERALDQAQTEFDNHGKLQSAIAETTLLTMQSEQAKFNAGSTSYEALTREIAAQEKLVAVLKKKEGRETAEALKEANEKAAKDMQAEQKRAAEASGKYWEDALMRAFESGKGFFQSLWDTIKNTLKTQVLKVMVQGTMGALGLGGSGAAMANGAGGSLIGSGLSSLGGSVINSLGLGSVSGALSGFGTAAVAATQSLVGMTGTAAQMTTSLVSAGHAAAPGMASGTALFNAIPGWGWAAMGAAVVASLADDLFGGGGGPKQESSYGGVYPVYGHSNTSATGTAGVFSLGVESAWGALAKQLGISNSLKVASSFGIDTQGDSPTQFHALAKVNGTSVYDRGARVGNPENVGRSDAELQAAMSEETTRILFAALKASDLPEQYKTYLNGIAGNVGDMNTAIANVSLLSGFTNALKALPFEELKNLSFDASKGLIEVAGGLENLQTNLGTYYTNFYSAEEQRLQTIKTINAATTGSGLDAATATRKSFRNLVEAQDLSTESGRKMYATLLSVSGAMGEVSSAAETLAKTNQGWKDKLALLTGAETERSIALRDATDDSTRAIMRQVYAQEDLTAASEAAAAMLQAVTDAQDSAMSAYMSAQSDYNDIIAQEQADAAQAMQDAAQATAQAAESIRSAMANAGSGITSLIRDLTTTRGGTLDPMALMRSTQRAYLTDLAGAQAGDAGASERVAASARAYIDANSAVTSSPRQAAIVAAIVAELGRLPAVQTYEQQLLAAVNATTAAVGANATTVAAALNAKLTAELNVSARSEILKLINFVANTDRLPDDLKTLALAQSSAFERTIGFINGSALSDDNKRLALAVATAFVRTFNFTIGSTLSDEAKKQAFAAVTAFDRTINIVTGSTLSEDLKRQAFNVATAFNRSINIVATSNMTDSLKQQAFGIVTNAGRAINIVATSNMTPALVQQAFSVVGDINRMVNITAGSTLLSGELKAQAFGTWDTITRAVGLVAGSTLSGELKSQAFGAYATISRTIELAAGSTMTAELKKQAFDAGTSLTRVVELTAGASMTDEMKRQAFGLTNSLTRTIELTAGSTMSGELKTQAFGLTNVLTRTLALTALSRASNPTAYDQAFAAGTDLKRDIELALKAGTSAEMQALAIGQAQTNYQRTIDALKGSMDPDALAVLNAVSNVDPITKTLTAAVDTSKLTPAQLSIWNAVNGSTATTITMSGAVTFDPSNGLMSVFNAIKESTQWLSDINTNISGDYGLRGYLANIQTNSQYLNRHFGASTAFAQGGVFTNSLVSSPTLFNMGLMGEAGPEAIMPLSRTSNGDLGVQVQMPDFSRYGRGENDAALVAEIHALRQELAELRQSSSRDNAQIASHVADSASTLRTIKNGGVQVWTDSAEPIAITGVDGGTP